MFTANSLNLHVGGRLSRDLPCQMMERERNRYIREIERQGPMFMRLVEVLSENRKSRLRFKS